MTVHPKSDKFAAAMEAAHRAPAGRLDRGIDRLLARVHYAVVFAFSCSFIFAMGILLGMAVTR